MRPPTQMPGMGVMEKCDGGGFVNCVQWKGGRRHLCIGRVSPRQLTVVMQRYSRDTTMST